MTLIQPLSTDKVKRPALFLDRDGVLNQIVMRDGVVSSPWKPEEFLPLDGAAALVQGAKARGYLTVVVTNQPDIARGNLSADALEKMHTRITQEFEVDAIEVCATSDDQDPRRKPNPGMILDAAQNLGIDLDRSFFVGDGKKDLLAGEAAGVRTVLLETDYNTAVHGKGTFNCSSHAAVLQIISE